jgi:hypothetical protein
MSEQGAQSLQIPPSAQIFQHIISVLIPPASLSRLLKFLTSVGIFSEDASGKYHQTPLSDTLRTDHPQSTRAVAILFGSALLWKPFGELATTVATGQPAFNHVFGASFFEYLSAHPEDAAIFNLTMG